MGCAGGAGSVTIDFEHEEAFKCGDGFYHTAVKGRKNRKIFNEYWKYVGEFPLAAVEQIDEGLILVKPHKDANHSTLYKKTALSAHPASIN